MTVRVVIPLPQQLQQLRAKNLSRHTNDMPRSCPHCLAIALDRTFPLNLSGCQRSISERMAFAFPSP